MLDHGTHGNGVTGGHWRNYEWRVPVFLVFQSVFQFVFQSICFVFMRVFQCSSIFTRAHA
jgi:hypothetical protein